MRRLLWLLLALHVLLLPLLPWWKVYFRYLIALGPVAALLTAWILTACVKPVVARVILAALVIGTNWIAVASGPRFSESHRILHGPADAGRCVVATGYPWSGPHGFSSPLISFARSLWSPYRDRAGEVIRYLRDHAGPDDELLSWDPELPIIYHTDLKVRNMLFATIAPDRRLPEWILIRSATGTLSLTMQAPAPLLQYYDRVVLRVPAGDRLGVMPDPDFHEYLTATQETDFILLRRR